MQTETQRKERFEQAVADRQRLLYGPRYVGCSISQICAPDWAQIKIAEYLKNPKNFLVYCGCPGIGKTFLCSALTEWAMKTFGNDFRYWKENNLLKGLRDSMENVQGDYLDVLKYMIDSEFLILDDVGSSVKLTEWREEILFETIDYRYNHLKPTMITSNFCSEDFKKIYHNRIYSRLFSIENTIIEIPHGVDFRLQNLSKLSNKIEKLQTER